MRHSHKFSLKSQVSANIGPRRKLSVLIYNLRIFNLNHLCLFTRTHFCMNSTIIIWVHIKSVICVILNPPPPHHQSSNPREPGLNINRSRGRWNWLSVLTLPLLLPLDMKSIKNVHNSCDRIHVFDSPTIYNHYSLELDSDAPRTRAELVHLLCFDNLHSRDRPIGLLD